MMSAKYYQDLKENSSTNKFYSNKHDFLENSISIYTPNTDGTVPLEERLRMDNKEYTKMWVDKGVISPIIVHNDASDIMTKLGCFYSVFKNDIVEGKISSCISTMEGKLGDYLYIYCVGGILFFTNIGKLLSLQRLLKRQSLSHLGLI